MRAWGWEWGPRDRGWYGDGEVLRQAWLGWIQNMGMDRDGVQSHPHAAL